MIGGPGAVADVAVRNMHPLNVHAPAGPSVSTVTPCYRSFPGPGRACVRERGGEGATASMTVCSTPSPHPVAAPRVFPSSCIITPTRQTLTQGCIRMADNHVRWGVPRPVLNIVLPQGGRYSPPPPDPPPNQTKLTIVGKTKFAIGKILSGDFWCTNFWVPDPRSPPSSR